MKQPQNTTGRCALCLKEGQKLIESHIIPEFMIRHVADSEPVGKNQGTRLVLSLFNYASLETEKVQRKKWFLLEEGILERLLCEACEILLHKGEDYVRKLLYGKAPELVHTPPQRLRYRYRTAPNGQVLKEGLELRTVKYKLFKQFQIGLLWRCCVAKGKAFIEIKVSDDLQERMRLAMFADVPPADLVPCQMEKLIGLPSVWLGTLGMPQLHGGVVEMYMGGYRWYYQVELGQDWPLTLLPSGRLITIARNSDLHENSPVQAAHFVRG